MFCHISHTFHHVSPPCTQYSGWKAIDNENLSGVRGHRVLSNGNGSNPCKDDDAEAGVTVCAETKEDCDGQPFQFFCEEVGNGLSCNTFSVYCDRSCDGTIEETWVEKKDE